MPYKYKKYKLCEIFWLDHAGSGGWQEESDFLEPPIECRSIGWLVREDKQRYFLASTLSSDAGQGGCSEILKATVTRFKVIRKSF